MTLQTHMDVCARFQMASFAKSKAQAHVSVTDMNSNGWILPGRQWSWSQHIIKVIHNHVSLVYCTLLAFNHPQCYVSSYETRRNTHTRKRISPSVKKRTNWSHHSAWRVCPKQLTHSFRFQTNLRATAHPLASPDTAEETREEVP